MPATLKPVPAGRRTRAARRSYRRETRRPLQAKPQVAPKAAPAQPALFAITHADGTFLRVKHHQYGMLAVVFTSRQVVGQFLSHKTKFFRSQHHIAMLRRTCFEQITDWCKLGRCNGCWIVGEGNYQHDYPCDNIILHAVPDPETGQFVAKGAA